MIPLSRTRHGETVRIVSVVGGRGVVRKLSDMGFFPGVEVRVISNPRRGPVILLKDGLRLGLGFGIACKVFVRPVGNTPEQEKGRV